MANFGTVRVISEVLLPRGGQQCVLKAHHIDKGSAYNVETWGPGKMKTAGYGCPHCVENWAGHVKWDIDDNDAVVTVDDYDGVSDEYPSPDEGAGFGFHIIGSVDDDPEDIDW